MRALSGQSAMSSTTQTPTATIVNSASLLECIQTPGPGTRGKCTNGMFVTFYIAPNVTSVTGDFSYLWPQELPDGFKLRYESCQAQPNNFIDMGILGVYQHTGYQQVNAYVPGDVALTQGEPYGSCNLINQQTVVTFNVLSAPGSPFRIAHGQANFFKQVTAERATPASFSANGSGTTGAPAGFHLNFNVGVPGGLYTPLQTCNADPSQCPVTTNGQPNFLVLYTTGGENIQCDSPMACDSQTDRPAIRLTNPQGARTRLVPDSITEAYLGQEQWNIRINTLVPDQQYTLTIVSGSLGAVDVASQAQTVKFGPAN